jgi:hypothetical protein
VADGAIVGTNGAVDGRELTPDGASDGDAEERVDDEPTEEGREDHSGIGDGREPTEEGGRDGPRSDGDAEVKVDGRAETDDGREEPTKFALGEAVGAAFGEKNAFSTRQRRRVRFGAMDQLRFTHRASFDIKCAGKTPRKHWK